jgi:hypothetical protein
LYLRITRDRPSFRGVMKKKGKKISTLAKQAAKIKIVKRLDTMEDAPFFKKKMEKGAKMLAIAGLPKC